LRKAKCFDLLIGTEVAVIKVAVLMFDLIYSCPRCEIIKTTNDVTGNVAGGARWSWNYGATIA
jgi:hypothetical protein